MSCGCNLRKRIIKEKLTVDKRDIYLDYNATTKPDIAVLAEIDKINRIFWGNPSAQNSRGVNLFNHILSKIDLCKEILNIEDYETWFDTSSSSIIEKIYRSNSYNDIITSTIEHPSLINNSKTQIDVDNNGRIKTELLKKKMANQSIKTKHLLVYSPINHETGNIQPFKDIYNIAKQNNVPVIFDAVQTIARLDPANWIPYCDGFYFSGHKIHGIQGGAVLFAKQNIFDFKLHNSPLPFSLYTGTLNTPGVIGVLEATIKLQHNFNNYIAELKVLHKEAINILNKIDNITIESSENGALGIINITLSSIEKIEDLLLFLNREGIHTGRLSACSGDINSPSTVLKMMGRDETTSKSSIRLSFGKDSKRDDFFRVSSSIRKYYNKV